GLEWGYRPDRPRPVHRPRSGDTSRRSHRPLAFRYTGGSIHSCMGASACSTGSSMSAFFSMFTMVPETHLAIIMLFNRNEAGPFFAIEEGILDEFLGLPEQMSASK